MIERWTTRRATDPEGGATAVEWVLILVFLALPMFYVFRLLLQLMAHYYAMVTFLETLPLS